MDSITATQMIGGKGSRKRSETDFYPTPPEVTIALLDFLRLPKNTVIWEPACGEFDMYNVLCDYAGVEEVLGSDINFGKGVDFLKSDLIREDVSFIITNPPFSASEEFIRHALDLDVPFAFLLKSQYWHAARRYDLFEECPPSYVLPLTWRPDFLFKQEGKHSPLMDVIWCVWMRDGGPTIYEPLPRPEGI